MIKRKLKHKLHLLLPLLLLLAPAWLRAQSIDIDVAPRVVCLGQPSTFSAVIVGYNPALVTSYTWRFGNGDSAVLNVGSPVSSTYTYQYINAGVYNITLVTRFNDGTTITRQINDTVYNRPSASFVMTSLDSQCFKSNSYTFNNTSTQGPFPSAPFASYRWVWGDGSNTDIANPSGPADNTSTHTFGLGNRRFQVSMTVTDQNGCSNVANRFVFVAPDLNPRFAVNGTPRCDGSPYIFVNQSPISLADVEWFRWYFDDGTTYFSNNPVLPCDQAMWTNFTHLYNKSGVFSPSLVVKHRRFNCIDSFNYSLSGGQMPENIVLQIDIRTKRTLTNDTITDSACFANNNEAAVCLYNNYPLQGVNVPVQVFWDYADPYNPFGTDKFLQAVPPCYQYLGIGHFFPTLRVTCQGQPPRIFNFFSRIDTINDTKNYNPGIMPTVLGSPPLANPPIYTINGYRFTPTDSITKYRWLLPPADPITGIPVTNVNAANDEFFRANHGLFNYDTIMFISLGGLSGVSAMTPYIVRSYCKDFFTISLVPDGPKVDFTFAGAMPTYRRFTQIKPKAVDSIKAEWKWFTDHEPDTAIKKVRGQLYGYGVNILGPDVMIEDGNPARPPIQMQQYMKNQCGPTFPVEFTNASKIYQSRHLYMLWDFADDYAPSCTSFSRPAANMALPPYATAQDLINNTEGYFVVNGRVNPGRVNCRYSHDTLPIHSYRNWYTEIYRWFKFGKDFPPYDSTGNGWTKDPSQVTWDGNQGRKLVHPLDTGGVAGWGKPMFSSPPTPYRIDSIDMWPNDINPNNPITINQPIPDPFATMRGFWQLTIPSGYRIDTGGFIFPNNLPPMPDGTSRRYRGNSIIPGTNKTFYEYVFERAVAACYTVTLNMMDSANNESFDPIRGRQRVAATIDNIVGADTTFRIILVDSAIRPRQANNTYNVLSVKNAWGQQVFPFRGDTSPVQYDGANYFTMIAADNLVVDEWDCGGEGTVQLPLMKPDAFGLGKDGLECPDLRSRNGGNPTIVFTQFDDFPGLAPTCANRTFLLFNYDSLLDRNDQTPCALDGFVQFDGTSPMTGQAVTPGGLRVPAFYNGVNFNPMTIWQNPNGQRNVTHYVKDPTDPYDDMPFHPEGFVTVGIIIGNGCLSPINCNQPGCLSDTVWYHNFFQFITLNAQFTYTRYDTNQVFNTPGGIIPNPNYLQPFNYLRGKGLDRNGIPNGLIFGVSYLTQQQYIKSDFWDWGDGTVTVDSFYTNLQDTFVILPSSPNPVFFKKGQFPIARVRYEFNADDPANWIVGDTMHFPIGVHVLDTFVWDTVWRCDDPLRAGPPQSVNQRWIRVDSMFFLMPVPHVYHRTSFEQKVPSGTAGVSTRRGDITPIIRGLQTITDCISATVRQIVIGVIDSCWANDTTFCIGETVFFTDSIRYWNPNATGTPPIYNPFRPLPLGAIPWVEVPLHRMGMRGYPNDTIKTGLNLTKYYVPPVNSPGCVFGWTPVPLFGAFNVCVKIDTFYYERIYWDFNSDGVIDAHGEKPTHKYTEPGRYKVSMISRDTMGFWDTCQIYINVVAPRAKFLSKEYFNCGENVTFTDSSYVDDWCQQNGGVSCDNIIQNRWWFGDFGYGPQDFRSILKNPQYDYLKNGWYNVMMVIETEQGCLDTFRRDIFLAGPRPRIKLLTDTLGCAPYRVRLVSFPNDSGALSVTKLTIVRTGLPNGLQIPITQNPDTIDIIYDKPGIYYLSTISYDSDPPSTATCPAVFTPDTTNGLEKPIFIHVKDPYHVEVETDKDKICVGEPFTIFNRSDFDTITRFRVFHMDSAFTNVLDTQYKTNFIRDTSFRYTYNTPGIYRIVLQSTRTIPDAPMCEYFDTVSVRAVTIKADFVIDSLGNSKFFLNNKTDSSVAKRYIWRIYKEDGSEFRVIDVPDNASPFRAFELDMKNDTGIYKVCLWAYTDDPVCEDSTCQMLENRFRIRIRIPNVFTPNGDNLNDVFKIDIEGEELFDLKIWNRWGGLVYETTDAKKLWNGKVNNTGADCPEGTYYYVLRYRLRTESEQTVRGTVTLIRD